MTEDDLIRLSRRVARKYTVPGMDSGDVSQEAFLAMWRAYSRRPSHPRLKAWLVFKARRHLIDLLNKALAKASQEADGEPLHEGDLPQLPTEESVDLSSLSPRERRCVEAVYKEGHTIAEVAASLGVTVNAVRRSLYRATTKLRRSCDLASLRPSTFRES